MITTSRFHVNFKCNQIEHLPFLDRITLFNYKIQKQLHISLQV